MYDILEALRAEGLPEKDCMQLATYIKNFEKSCYEIPQQITGTENNYLSTETNEIKGESLNKSTQLTRPTCKETETTVQRTEEAKMTYERTTSDEMCGYQERKEQLEKKLRDLSDKLVDGVMGSLEFDKTDKPQEIEVKLVAMERLHGWLNRLLDTLIDAIKKAFQWMKEKVVNVASKVKEFFCHVFKSLFGNI